MSDVCCAQCWSGARHHCYCCRENAPNAMKDEFMNDRNDNDIIQNGIYYKDVNVTKLVIFVVLVTLIISFLGLLVCKIKCNDKIKKKELNNFDSNNENTQLIV